MDKENLEKLCALADDAIDNAKDEDTAIECFEPIADFLMNKCVIVANNKPHRICNIEFYLYTDKHPDNATDPNEDHEQRRKWYIKFKGYSRTRIDIALGRPNVPFGVLLCNVIDGWETGSHPNLTLKQLANVNRKLTTDEFRSVCNKLKSTDMFTKDNILYIDTVGEDIKKKVLHCKRKNINKSKPFAECEYKFYLEGTKPK